MERKCYKCKQVKDLYSEFSKSINDPLGYHHICKECSKIETKKYKEKKYQQYRDVYPSPPGEPIKRKCWVCKQEKDLNNNFYKDSHKKCGFQGMCKDCCKVRNKKYLEEHKEYFQRKGKENYHPEENHDRYMKTRDNYLARHDKYLRSVRGRLYSLFRSVRSRAKNKNSIDFDLNWLIEQYNKQNGRCLLTNIPFSLDRNTDGKRFYRPYSPSLDKINAKGDYTKDNVRLVLTAVNIALNQWGEDVYENVCRNYIKTKNEKMIMNQDYSV